MQVPEAFWKSFGEALAPALKETSSLSGMGATEGGVLSVEDIITRFSAAMEEESPACVRLNPWKRAPLPILDGAVQVPWCDEGWRLSARPVYTLHPLFHAGAYYVQDASSMFVGAVLRKILRLPDIRQRAAEHPLRVLDLCAAPGGKTTDAAASLRKVFGDHFELLSNEINPRRAAILKDNVEIWGDPQVSVCCQSPGHLGRRRACFDIILVDAPCSGEGMFRKEPQALGQWSLKKVEECAALQRSILDDIAPALAPGGYLIYSTCTYNRQENEGSAAHLLESGNFEAIDLKFLMAGETAAARNDGQTLLFSPLNSARTDTPSASVPPAADTPSAPVLPTADTPAASCSGTAFPQACGVRLIPGLVHGEGQFCALFRDSKKFSPSVMAPRASETLLRAESPAASPDSPTSYALDRSRWPNMAVDKQTALNFLHGDSLILPDAPKGLLLLTYKDIPLGFVKNIGARCNNLHPKSRRIKMDVKQ